MKIDDFFFLLIATGSGNGDIITNMQLAQLPNLMGKQLMPIISYGKGIPASRTALLKNLKNFLDENKIEHKGKARVLMWDDDLIMDRKYDLKELAETFIKADKEGWNLIGNYKVFNEQAPGGVTNVMMHTNGDMAKCFYTQEEIDKLKTFDVLKDTACGLGFYYGEVDLDYEYHYDHVPEDVGFFVDNKQELRFVKIKLGHKKTTII